MSKKSSINQLLKCPSVWQASHAERSRPTAKTGFSQLDELLHDGGWPQGALTELLLQADGVGELRLLAPLLKQLSQQSGYLVLMDPPFIPYGPALRNMGIDIGKLFVVQTGSVSRKVWSAYQALTSRSCAAVLVWFQGNAPYKHEIRKLSLAARQGQCWGIVFRQAKAAQHPSAARLRVQLQAAAQGQSHLTVLKQAGGWSGQELTLPLVPEQVQWTAVAGKHWPVYRPPATADTSSVSANVGRAITSSIERLIIDAEQTSYSSTPSVH